MTLPPLCNLFAAFVPDSTECEHLRSRMVTSGAFTAVETLAQNWIIGLAPLPGANSSERERKAGFAFFEGADLFSDEGRQSLPALAMAVAEHPERLAAFAGDFGFIRFQLDGVTVVRSCAGRVPIYYRQQGDRIYLGSRLDYLVAFVHDGVKLDGLATTAILGGCCVFPEGRTPIQGVQCLPAAHYVALGSSGSATPRRYWSPREALAATPNSEQQAARLREILLDTLRRELDPSGGNLLFFSGGVDSSALAALACEGLGLSLFTQTFTCPDEATARHEDQYILPLEQRYRFTRIWREPKTSARCLELAQKAPELSLPVLHLGAPLLAEIAADAPIRVALDGEFADEGCGSPRRIGDWLDSASFWELVLKGAETPLGKQAPLRWLTWRAKRLLHRQWIYLPAVAPEGTRLDVQREYADWVALERQRFAHDTLPLRTLAFRVSRDQWLAEAWEATTSLGIRPLSAFYTRAALELYFACQPRDLFDGKRPKALLRNAMKGHMPEQNRLRPDKGEWPPYLESARAKVALRSQSRVLDLLDEHWLQQHFVRIPGSGLQPTEMGFFDALRLTSLGNMLSAIDRLVGPKPF